MEPPTNDLSLDAAREALEAHVRMTRWLRRDLAKRLTVESFQRSGSFHVRFRSFTEDRVFEPAFEPYRGGAIDGPQNGQPPQPWEMEVRVPGTFVNQDAFRRVPHTDVVRTCHTCQGSAQIKCPRCDGLRNVTCSRCSGTGNVTETRQVTRTNQQGQTEHFTETYQTSCGACGGDGRVTCPECHGQGLITCPTCQGARQIKHWLQLRVTWKTTTTDRILEKTGLPDHLVGGAQGQVIHAEEDDQLAAISLATASGGPYRGTAPRVSPEVNEICNQLLASHRFSRDTKLWRQSIHVKAVPVHEARYRWGKGTRTFWIFGDDQQVYAPHYPLSIQRVGMAVGVPLAVLLSGGALLWAATEPPTPAPTHTIAPPNGGPR